MIVLGVILLVCGLLFHVHVLTVLGIICVIVGAVLALCGAAGRPVGGRRFWY